MTGSRINEIIELINVQNLKLSHLKSEIDIALGEGFLDYSKTIIHDHLSMIDDKMTEIIELNYKIVGKITVKEKI